MTRGEADGIQRAEGGLRLGVFVCIGREGAPFRFRVRGEGIVGCDRIQKMSGLVVVLQVQERVSASFKNVKLLGVL